MEDMRFIVEDTLTGFSAYAENYPVFTTGASIAKLKSNIREAMNLYLEEIGGEPLRELPDLQIG